MAQLTDDCFAFSGPLLRLDDMERLIGERVTAVAETEHIPLHGARTRVAAFDVKAPVDLPLFDNSAVDGYAVRHADLRSDGDTRLAIAGRLTAGARADLALSPGQAIRIFTGAAMPKGADTVFMQEDVTVDGDHVVVPSGLKRGANRRLAGEDVPAGRVVVPAGTVLEAQHIALAAALGLTEFEVRRRLKVAIFSTGDEVVEPGSVRGAAADLRRQPLSAGRAARAAGRAGHRSRHSRRRARAACARAWQRAPPITTWCSPRAASPPAKPTTCAARSSASATWCSGASPSSRDGRWRWA